MYNKCDFAILDFETTGLKNGKQPTEIACVIIDGHKLTLKDQGVFTSLCSIIPDDQVDVYGLDKTDPKALEVANITQDQLDNAPPLKKVWQDFENFVKYHNPTSDPYKNPILIGCNLDFDKSLLDNIKLGLHRGKQIMPSKPMPKNKISKMTEKELKKYLNEWRPLKEPWKFSEAKIFHKIYKMDTIQNHFNWFSYMREPYKLGQVAVCDFLGLDTSKAHTALHDVLITAEIFIRMLKIQRQVSNETDFNTKGVTNLPILETVKNYGR